MKTSGLLLSLMMASPVLAGNDPCGLFGVCPGGIVYEGLTVETADQCRAWYEVSPFTASPFIEDLCERNIVIHQQTDHYDRAFFIRKQSPIVAGADGVVADLDVLGTGLLRFYIDYGTADPITSQELERLYPEADPRTPKPYVGKPLENLRLEMLADMALFRLDQRHRTIHYDPALGTNFFDSITVQPKPDLSQAFVSIKLSRLGQSIFAQAMEQGIPLFGVLDWKVNHCFGTIAEGCEADGKGPVSGPYDGLVVQSVGDLSCLKLVKTGGKTKVKICSE